jgi:predicted DNA-binding transcriptional regulator YafY
VYRDIKTLETAGIPIAGEAGVGYSIMEGFRLPPVMFTSEEAIAFLTAEKMLSTLTDAETKRHFQSAMYKIKSVLRYAEKDLLENMNDVIEVVPNPYLPPLTENSVQLTVMLTCITKKEVLNIDYFANHTQENSSRDIDPVGIFFLGSHWHLIAWCRLRNDYRHFRTDRIRSLKPTGLFFKKQHPSLQSFLANMSKEKEMFTIIIRIEKSVLQYMGDQKFYNGFVSQKEVAGKIEMTFVTASLRGFSKYYLLFGEYAEIVSPVELKALVRENLEALRLMVEG